MALKIIISGGDMLTIGRIFYVECAHHLPKHKGNCKFLHGHSYKIEIVLVGKQHQGGLQKGMIMDFGILKNVVNKKVIDIIDHKLLNNIPGLENPTVENMAKWIVYILIGKNPVTLTLVEQSFETKLMMDHLLQVKVWETKDSYACFENLDVE